MKNPIRITSRISKEMAAVIDWYAEQDERSRDSMVRVLLREALDARKREEVAK